MLDLILNVISWFFILTGGIFSIVGAVGQLRFPDFWARLHAASVTDSAGVTLLIVGMILQTGLTLVSFKLAAIGIFLFITGATSTHAVASAALVTGLKPPSLKKSKSASKSSANSKAAES